MTCSMVRMAPIIEIALAVLLVVPAKEKVPLKELNAPIKVRSLEIFGVEDPFIPVQLSDLHREYGLVVPSEDLERPPLMIPRVEPLVRWFGVELRALLRIRDVIRERLGAEDPVSRLFDANDAGREGVALVPMRQPLWNEKSSRQAEKVPVYDLAMPIRLYLDRRELVFEPVQTMIRIYHRAFALQVLFPAGVERKPSVDERFDAEDRATQAARVLLERVIEDYRDLVKQNKAEQSAVDALEAFQKVILEKHDALRKLIEERKNPAPESKQRSL